MSFDKFSDRHTGLNAEERRSMLETLGLRSMDELISQIVPSSIRLKKPLSLPESMSEWAFAEHIRTLGEKNQIFRSFIGMGYYGTATPAVIMRNVFENPAWYTSYTPYQAEISQGRLEALLIFQTAITSLTGMEISNCSLLDEGTSAAEAMSMMFSLRSRQAVAQGKNVLFVDRNIFPQTLDVLLTRSEPVGIEIIVDDFRDYDFCGREFGVILQYPAADGTVNDYEEFTAMAHSRDVLVSVAADLISLALLREPGTWGADIVVGSSQRLGLPMGFGGPHSGFLATREAFKRNMPGRIIGVSVDRLGNRALRMALQTREQHIKRDKATSNICTASALMASMSGLFAVYHGAEGMKRIAAHIYTRTHALAETLRAMGCKILNHNYFDTLEIEIEAAVVQQIALEYGVNLYYKGENTVHLSLDEITTDEEVALLVEIFARALGKRIPKNIRIDEEALPAEKYLRTNPFLDREAFRNYRTETELMRFIKRLERRDISLADSMIPLGSCTMKLNSAVSMMPLSLAEFANIHPFAPASQAEGYMEMIAELERDLAVITGFDAVTLQPNSGAAGEYAGLMVIRAYHQSRAQGYRNVALIPASAHGTNPATAAVAGMKIVVVVCDEQGNIDVADLKAKANEYATELSCLMATYPSTHGVFEERIREIVDIIHDVGGQVYMDGANMNAMVGLSNPGYIGADVCHLNLHKTFGMPHGGGGPGAGPICVAAHLAPFLPSHPVVPVGGESSITAVASAPYGSALLLPIAYAYIKMLGIQGLREATEVAILSANYLSERLKGEFRTFFSGASGRVGHELILDLQNFRYDYGVECADVARRLMDYGFHAPTLSFPVQDTFMIEPTESESKAEIDRFIEAMISIKRECETISDREDNLLKNAPHTAIEIASDEWPHPYTRAEAAFAADWLKEGKFFPYVSRVDAGHGDRNLVCCCQ